MQYIKEIINEIIYDIEFQSQLLDENLSETAIKNTSKRVTFNFNPSIQIIPNMIDLISYSDIQYHELWWNSLDYFTFQCSAKSDIIRFIRRYPNENIEKIHKRLWYEYDETYYLPEYYQ